MDGYPYSYASFKTRLHRWTRGDFQIYQWIKKHIIDKKEIKKKNPLNFLSKYKIFDNLIRAIQPISIMLLIIITVILNITITCKSTPSNSHRKTDAISHLGSQIETNAIPHLGSQIETNATPTVGVAPMEGPNRR